VLYFVRKPRHQGDREVTVSLAKLKTLEYRLFRKMREKLRGYFHVTKDHGAPGADPANLSFARFEEITRKFKKESEEFLEGGQNSLPQDLSYYVNVFKQAYHFIKEDPKQVEVLQKEYVTFSENLLTYIAKQDKTQSSNAFFFSDVLDK